MCFHKRGSGAWRSTSLRPARHLITDILGYALDIMFRTYSIFHQKTFNTRKADSLVRRAALVESLLATGETEHPRRLKNS